jgi:hypothetical protein
MPYGTIISIALILVVACSLLGWLSALLADTDPKRDGKALKTLPEARDATTQRRVQALAAEHAQPSRATPPP